MRFRWLAFVALFTLPAMLVVAASPVVAGAPRRQATGREPGRAAAATSAPRVCFEENRGQTDPRARMVARAAGCVAFLTNDGAVVKTAAGAFALRLDGAAGRVEALEPLPGRSNYLVGNDPSKWVRDVPQHGGARLAGALPGIGLR